MLHSYIEHVVLAFLFTSLSSAKRPEYNVLHGANFPDPSIINVNGRSYAFSTTSNGLNTPMTHNQHFHDASGWSEITDVFPTDDVPAFGKGGWAEEGTTWAPDVQHLVSSPQPSKCFLS